MASLISDQLKPKPQPQFPDYSSNYQKMIAAQTACTAQGGSFSSSGCYVPPPPPAPVYVAPLAPAVTYSGNCSVWMAAAGITDTADAIQVINIESGCNPNAVNRYSGACGIGQQLPCGKWPHTWNDPVGGLIDMQNYVYADYGSWANALAHERAYGYY